MTDVEKFLIKKFHEICELENERLEINDPLESCEEWDSLNLLTFLTEIDDKYGITIPADKVDEFKTLKDFSAYIEKAS